MSVRYSADLSSPVCDRRSRPLFRLPSVELSASAHLSYQQGKHTRFSIEQSESTNIINNRDCKLLDHRTSPISAISAVLRKQQVMDDLEWRLRPFSQSGSSASVGARGEGNAPTRNCQPLKCKDIRAVEKARLRRTLLENITDDKEELAEGRGSGEACGGREEIARVRARGFELNADVVECLRALKPASISTTSMSQSMPKKLSTQSPCVKNPTRISREPQYADPFLNSTPMFQQRVRELVTLQSETLRWEQGKKNKKKS